MNDDERNGSGTMSTSSTRAGMTEGQLYSAVFVALVVLLLSLTGLPTAERQPESQPFAPPPPAAPAGDVAP